MNDTASIGPALTIESLAIALQETAIQAAVSTLGFKEADRQYYLTHWEDADQDLRKTRIEQARLLFNRIMR